MIQQTAFLIVIQTLTHSPRHSPKGMSPGHSPGDSPSHSMGSTPDIINCSEFDCGAACLGDCGWSSVESRCVFGGTTSPSEMGRGPGCLNYNSQVETTTISNHGTTQTSEATTSSEEEATSSSEEEATTSSEEEATSSSQTTSSEEEATSSSEEEATTNGDVFIQIMGKGEDEYQTITISPSSETNQGSNAESQSNSIIYIPIVCVVLVAIIVGAILRKKKVSVDVRDVENSNKTNTVPPLNSFGAVYAEAVNYEDPLVQYDVPNKNREEESYGFASENLNSTKQPQYDLSGNIIDNDYELGGNQEVNYDLAGGEPQYELANNCYEEPVTQEVLYNIAD